MRYSADEVKSCQKACQAGKESPDAVESTSPNKVCFYSIVGFPFHRWRDSRSAYGREEELLCPSSVVRFSGFGKAAVSQPDHSAPFDAINPYPPIANRRSGTQTAGINR